jgi:hypothetical protein
MANNILTRQDDEMIVMYLLPNVNYKTVGSIRVPVPYPAYAKLQGALGTKQNVLANGYPLITHDSSYVPHTPGGEDGDQGGVMSGTVAQDTWPINASDSTADNEERVTRNIEDLFAMNGTHAG